MSFIYIFLASKVGNQVKDFAVAGLQKSIENEYRVELPGPVQKFIEILAFTMAMLDNCQKKLKTFLGLESNNPWMTIPKMAFDYAAMTAKNAVVVAVVTPLILSAVAMASLFGGYKMYQASQTQSSNKGSGEEITNIAYKTLKFLPLMATLVIIYNESYEKEMNNNKKPGQEQGNRVGEAKKQGRQSCLEYIGEVMKSIQKYPSEKFSSVVKSFTSFQNRIFDNPPPQGGTVKR